MDRFMKKLKIEESFDYNFSYNVVDTVYDEDGEILDFFYNYEKEV